MKQINTINRFLARLGGVAVLFGALIIAPSGAFAQSKNSTGVSGQKGESGKTVQPKKVKQQSLSNQRPVETRKVPSSAVEAQGKTSAQAKNANAANGKPMTAEARKQMLKQENLEKEKLSQTKKSPASNNQSLSNKPAPGSQQPNTAQAASSSDNRNVQADWEKKREKTKSQLLAKGLSSAEVEKKLQEMDKQVQSSKK